MDLIYGGITTSSIQTPPNFLLFALQVSPSKWTAAACSKQTTNIIHPNMFQNISEWPTIDPLPSYGRGRDLPGPRYSNFITGYNLTDVIITGYPNSTS